MWEFDFNFSKTRQQISVKLVFRGGKKGVLEMFPFILCCETQKCVTAMKRPGIKLCLSETLFVRVVRNVPLSFHRKETGLLSLFLLSVVTTYLIITF